MTNQGCPPFRVFSVRITAQIRARIHRGGVFKEWHTQPAFTLAAGPGGKKKEREKQKKKIVSGSRTIQKLRCKAPEGREAGVNSS